ncbi:hypothetical protein M378DRAFT_159142 [Amanita muscaria Koide BX008]|uniref:UAA transporter n=1 Tax=Amanita muscaria (strain Koide BX008) TaxID=946122 RepID=A0A0C2TLC0_AMAMK|nr:hypothetical protein M378DRAFT_159142 [Amanita muscaria Koide BX008]
MAAKVRNAANGDVSKDRDDDNHVAPPPTLAVNLKNELSPLASQMFQLAPVLIDYQSALLEVFGGCCSNAWTYEQLFTTCPRIGSALTFAQMLFISALTLPSFITFQGPFWVPRLKQRQVPLSRWLLHVSLFTFSSLLLNWAHGYKVPLTVLIVFRSAGLAISMLFGFIFLKKRYTLMQTLSVVVVSTGVVLATKSRPSPASSASSPSSTFAIEEDSRQYLIGILMMILSSISTGILGLVQERTYKTYGPCWKEAVFYTHCLSLPIVLLLYKDVKRGFLDLASTSTTSMVPFVILAGNVVSQLICVSGVNKLNTQMSAVSTNLVLTARKALSLCFSVWWFGNEWNVQFGAGAVMVFVGSVLFSMVGQEPKTKIS